MMDAGNLNEYNGVGQVLPEVEIVANSSGLTLYCPKGLKTPRFIPFDLKGQCQHCRSSDLEVDYMVDQAGISVSTNRMKKTQYIPYDLMGEFSPEGAIVARIRRKHFTLPFKRILQRPFKTTATTQTNKKQKVAPIEQRNDDGITLEETVSQVAAIDIVVKNEDIKQGDDDIVEIKNEITDNNNNVNDAV
jgi:hypothetical protein